MGNLGFGDGYVAQGGDIGSKVARILGAKYSSCKGTTSLSSPLDFPNLNQSLKYINILISCSRYVKANTKV